MQVLVINSGSSSLKYALYRDEELVFRGSDGDLFSLLEGEEIDAVGHRIVHGGPGFSSPCLIDEKVLQAVEELTPFDPEHLPHALKAIHTIAKRYPGIPQVACFDTVFHRTMPKVAKQLPLPRKFFDEGIYRYGFHGISYAYIAEQLTERKAIVAHLGNGASMAAIKDGKSVDTTMGFTPTGGIVMSSRTGDLDPGVLLYLLKEKNISESGLAHLLNAESGLLGVSGKSSSMKELLSLNDTSCQEAISLFCYSAKKALLGLMAPLQGIETLVFTGGIGENSPEIRQRICEGLEFVGISLDKEKNRLNASVISSESSQVLVRVIETNEELMIAKETLRLL